MKSVMISIQPKWCELIANGEKTIEVRKTKPKLEMPFKCYIYCTKAKNHFSHNGISEAEDELYRLPDGKIKFGYSGELMLYDDYDENNFLNGKVIGEFVCDDIVTDKTFGHAAFYKTQACLNDSEIAAYCTNNEIYAWHISDLKIYDKPKELSGFHHCGQNYYFNPPITKPPQSWCYVEKVKE